MKFAATDSACGSRESTNRPADPNSKKVTEENGHQHNHDDEGQSLFIKFVHACIGTSIVQAALGDNRPIDLWECAVRPDHFDRMLGPLFRKANRFRIAEVPGQSANLVDDLPTG